ncbi:MAG TPA: hypothetical protein DIW46_06520 [Microbacterium sp.]|nr:hypothetical protein [Microbacterium sp.]
MLSNADVAVLHAVTLQKKFEGRSYVRSDLEVLPRQSMRPVRPLIANDEVMMASGGCAIHVWDAPGDGSYTASQTPVVGTGFGNSTGTAQMAGLAVGTIAVNMFSASRAHKDAQPRWMDFIPNGALTVSTHGLYIEDATQGLLTWGWNLIQSIEWGGPSRIVFRIATDDGSVQASLASDWAELAYITWIHAVFPDHPQKYLYTTADWAERVRTDLGWDPWTGQPVVAVGQSEPPQSLTAADA